MAYISQRNSSTDFPVLACALSERDGQYACAIGARPMPAVRLADDKGLLAQGVEVDPEATTEIPAQNGNSLVLTLDSDIQSILEKHLETALADNPDARDGVSGIVMNVKTGEVASARMMPLGQALDIVACVRSIGSGVAEGGWSLFAPGVAGFDRELNRVKFRDRGARADGSTNFSFVENALANGQEVEEIPTIDDALAGLSTDVYKLGIMLDTVEETDAAMDALRASSALGDLDLALTGPTELEITQMGVNKGSALSILCEKLGVDESRAVAFGDSGNDATFADSACTFVAMGNATPEIKAVADEECPADADDGVAVWIEENILA